MVTAYLRWSDHLVALSHGSVFASYMPTKWSRETELSGGRGASCACVTPGFCQPGPAPSRLMYRTCDAPRDVSGDHVLVSGRMFGILSPFVGGDYYGAIIEGINAAATGGGDRIMATQTLDPGAHSADRAGIPDFRKPLAWKQLAGLVVLPGAVDTAYAIEARACGLPVVFVAQDADGSGCSAVLADNRSGVRDAVAHLIAHGHERIAFAGHLSHFDLRERHEGYREGLLAHGITPRPDLLFETGDNHEGGGETVADALIRAGMPATAVVLGTDRNAIGLTDRMTAAGYRLPEEL